MGNQREFRGEGLSGLDVGVGGEHIRFVTTLSERQASKNLGELLERALNGEEIGIKRSGRVVVLRPVIEDAAAEYGLSEEELGRAFGKISKEVAEERKNGKLRKVA